MCGRYHQRVIVTLNLHNGNIKGVQGRCVRLLFIHGTNEDEKKRGGEGVVYIYTIVSYA